MPVLRDDPGRFAVGVIDQTTGVTATYHGSWLFDTASIVKADILPVLLIQHQQIGTTLSPGEGSARHRDDRRQRRQCGHRAVGRRGRGTWNGGRQCHTRPARHLPGHERRLGLTTTTVAGQLRLLTDLTSARSPLNAASRAYELSLMRHVQPGQNWASPPPPTPAGQSVINSIGVVTHAGHQLLIALLSSGQPTEDNDISQAQAAARAAASAITGPP